MNPAGRSSVIGRRVRLIAHMQAHPSPFLHADVVKVRLQLAKNNLEVGARSPGMVQTGINVVRGEGVSALWSGLGPSLARGFFFGGARLGLYTPIKTALCGENSNPG